MLRNNWFTALLIFSMPISLIYFLGSQMAYSQVERRFETYTAIPEYTSLADLQLVAHEETVLLRGEIANSNGDDSSTNGDAGNPLLIYQERPLDGREVRFREEFSLVLPSFDLALADGKVTVQPDESIERVISHELQRVVLDDREFTGFQMGDIITVQGKWQPTTDANSTPMLLDLAGITGAEKATLLAEVEAAMVQVKQARNGLGLLTLVSILLLAIQLYGKKKRAIDVINEQSLNQSHNQPDINEEDQRWHTSTAGKIPEKVPESVPTI